MIYSARGTERAIQEILSQGVVGVALAGKFSNGASLWAGPDGCHRVSVGYGSETKFIQAGETGAIGKVGSFGDLRSRMNERYSSALLEDKPSFLLVGSAKQTGRVALAYTVYCPELDGFERPAGYNQLSYELADVQVLGNLAEHLKREPRVAMRALLRNSFLFCVDDSPSGYQGRLIPGNEIHVVDMDALRDAESDRLAQNPKNGYILVGDGTPYAPQHLFDPAMEAGTVARYSFAQ